MSEVSETWLPPPANLEMAPGEVHVWRLSLEWPQITLEKYRQLLTGDELKRAGRFYFEKDRHHFTAGRAILRSILAIYLKEEPARLTFEYGPQGKPVLGGEFKGRFEFNLSHSHQLGLLAVTQRHALGIDIEYPRGNIAINDLVKRFFAPTEVAAIQNLAPELKREAFFNAWTRKEAYLKACGGGISIGLDRVLVTFLPGEIARIIEIGGNKEEAARWSAVELNPGPGYQAALVAETPEFALKCWQWPD